MGMVKRQYLWLLFNTAFSKPWLWAGGISLFVTIVCGIISYFHKDWEMLMQTLTWAIPLAIFVVLGLWRLSIAPYLIKIGEKDKELEQKQRRIDGLLEAANASVSIPSKLLTIEAQVEGFGKPSDEGYPPFDDNTILWARIWPHFNGLGVMLVESVTLDILGSSIPALDWEPVKVCSLITEGPPVGFVYFALREDITSGRYTAKILAFAEGKWWPSEPFLIDIPKR